MSPTSALDESLVNRATPPGSMRYFALLYTPPEKRDAVTALFVVDAEIREAAQSPNHDVAHTRLQWWRQEIDRLINANAQHPATRILSSRDPGRRQQLSKLHEPIAAADMDLARMTYVNAQEMRAYCSRSGGVITELIALELAAPTGLDDATRTAANAIGACARATEILRDVRQDAYDGRLYLPLEELDPQTVGIEALRSKDPSPAVRSALSAVGARIRSDLGNALTTIAPPMRAYLRPLYVLAGLHEALVARIAHRDYDVSTERIELGPIQKPWVAWRSARRAG